MCTTSPAALASPRAEPADWLQVSQPLGYTGTGFDFQYLRAHWFNPKAGRFLQRDSVRGALTTPTALHRDAYAHHNPLAYHDPTGHWAWPHTWYPGWGLDQLGGTVLLEGGPTPGECWNTGLTCAQMQAWALNAPAELGGLGGVAMIGASLGPAYSGRVAGLLVEAYEHFWQRLAERTAQPSRGITEAAVRRAITRGRIYYDPRYDSYVRVDPLTVVAVSMDDPIVGPLRNVQQGSPAPRWNPVPWRPWEGP